MEHWFVYYKVPAQDARKCVAAVQPMQQALAASSGVRGQCLRRADEPGSSATLMEVYPDIGDPAAFAELLARAVNAAKLPADGRRLERFVEA
jgi:hypothetical protein